MKQRCDGVNRHHARGRRCMLISLGCAALFVPFSLTPTAGQTPQEHEQHHPATPPPVTTPAPGQPAIPSPPAEPSAPGAAMMGGMGQAMGGGEMCCGGAPPPSPLYPAMMAMPELTPERRTELERQAGERMFAGSAMMSDAFGRPHRRHAEWRPCGDAGGQRAGPRRPRAVREWPGAATRPRRRPCAARCRARVVPEGNESGPADQQSASPRSLWSVVVSLHCHVHPDRVCGVDDRDVFP